MQSDSIRKKMHGVFAFSAAEKGFPASLVFAFGGDFAPAFFGGVGVDTAAKDLLAMLWLEQLMS